MTGSEPRTPNPESRAVQLTPPGRAALAGVLVEGPLAAQAVGRRFAAADRRALGEQPVGRIVFGRWRSSPGPGEEVIVCRRDEDRVEIHCHGGTVAVAIILADLAAAGCRQIDWRDWVQADTADPIAAAARLALAEARTLRTCSILMDQYNGALAAGVRQVESLIAGGEEAAASDRLAEMLDLASLGLHLTRPWRVVLAGRTNVGKSSLINAIVGYERAIVFEQPGTTRDVLTASAALDGWPVELSDTAGLARGGDELESAAVAAAQRKVAQADLVLLICDRSASWSAEDQRLLDELPAALLVHNKSDLPPAAACPPGIPGCQGQLAARELNTGRQAASATGPGIATSAKTGAGISELIEAIAGRLVSQAPPPGVAVPFTQRQVDLLQAAAAALSRGESVCHWLHQCLFDI